MNKALIPILFLFFSVTSCKNTKNITNTKGNATSSKVLIKNMYEADFNYQYLSAKARANYNDGTVNQSFTANIRIEHNKTIWLSLTGPFGIEGARILIEPNNIQIINKLNNTYENKPLSYINGFLPFEVDLPFLENILIGNTFNISNNGKQKVELEKDSYIIKESNQDTNATFYVDKEFKYKKVHLTQEKLNRKVNLIYNDYKFIENQLFAFLRDITFTENEDIVRLNLEYSKVKIEDNLDFPFTVPDRLKTND